MGRFARAVIPGIAHHITQRGNHREQVFFCDDDRRVYVAILADRAKQYGVRLLGYCLMTNHVHFVAVPEFADSLAKAFGRTHNDYARWLHVRQRLCGHLWQNRFFSCPLDSGHTWAALRYVECNPVRAGMVESAEQWPWSSARSHLAGTDLQGLLDLSTWASCWTPRSWADALRHGTADAALIERVRQSTRTGRPLGGAGFAESLEQVLNRPLAPRRPGPKPTVKAASATG